MRTLMSFDEIEIICEAIVKDYLKKKHYTNVLCLDIEGMVTEYMGGTIQYETFAEDDSGRNGFLADGMTGLKVFQKGKVLNKIFPEKTVVIEKGLLCPRESGRKRFTVAHEAGHIFMNQYMNFPKQSAYHSEYQQEQNYAPEALQQMFSIMEVYADRVGACLLMPRFLLQRALKRHNSDRKLIVYGDGVMARSEKLKLQKIADAMGVSFSACYLRMKELGLFEVLPMEEYLHKELGFGGDCIG